MDFLTTSKLHFYCFGFPIFFIINANRYFFLHIFISYFFVIAVLGSYVHYDNWLLSNITHKTNYQRNYRVSVKTTKGKHTHSHKYTKDKWIIHPNIVNRLCLSLSVHWILKEESRFHLNLISFQKAKVFYIYTKWIHLFLQLVILDSSCMLKISYRF